MIWVERIFVEGVEDLASELVHWSEEGRQGRRRGATYLHKVSWTGYGGKRNFVTGEKVGREKKSLSWLSFLAWLRAYVWMDGAGAEEGGWEREREGKKRRKLLVFIPSTFALIFSSPPEEGWDMGVLLTAAEAYEREWERERRLISYLLKFVIIESLISY